MRAQQRRGGRLRPIRVVGGGRYRNRNIGYKTLEAQPSCLPHVFLVGNGRSMTAAWSPGCYAGRRIVARTDTSRRFLLSGLFGSSLAFRRLLPALHGGCQQEDAASPITMVVRL